MVVPAFKAATAASVLFYFDWDMNWNLYWYRNMFFHRYMDFLVNRIWFVNVYLYWYWYWFFDFNWYLNENN